MAGFNTLSKGNGLVPEGLAGGSTLNPFGSLNVGEQTPSAQATFTYGVSPAQWTTASNGASASVTASEGIVTCSSGISTSGSAGVFLRRGMKYRAGQGGIGKFTAIFDPGVEGSSASQLVGLGNSSCGYYFAKIGTNFGILHTDTAKAEIRKLTVSAAGGTENVTITLDGKSKTFPIVGGSNVNQTSHQISSHDFSQLGYGWDAEAIDGTVYFISNRPRSFFTGSYGIASSGTASGSFSIVQHGVNPRSTFISQSQWNVDTMNGNGPSRIVLNTTKGNVYSVGYQYLGFGNAIFSIEDANKGILVPVHQLKYANARDTVVLKNPHVLAQWAVENEGSSTSVSIKGGSAALFTEGTINRNIGPSFATGSVKSSIGSTTIVPILSLRSNQVFKDQKCYGEIDPYSISVGADFNSAASTNLLNVYVYRNVDLSGPVNWTHVNSDVSICAADRSATGITVTGASARLMKSFVVAANDQSTFEIPAGELFLANRDVMTVAAITTGGTATVSVNISWHEDQ